MLHSHHLLYHFTPLLPGPAPAPPRHHSAAAAALRRGLLAGAAGLQSRLAELPDDAPPPPPPPVEDDGGGPVELPSSAPSTIFAVDDNPSPLQVATSVLLTGAISLFLYRSLRRRAERAKELRVRSTGLKKTKDMKEEALDSLKAMGATSIDAGPPPSPAQAFLGGIAAGVIALILYKFTTTIEAALNRQAISDNFSVRQITITIRTIVNGLCYLATFVFGINSIGLTLYSLQLAIGSIMDGGSGKSPSSKEEGEQLNTKASDESSSENVESASNDLQQTSDKSKN
ncbi:hypothetical protein ACMD2_05448 [Ananas comosus]|uniref:DUF3082 domain-containing protein n=1 Tax=Ananas comosus TaxID=4615 RepID=A0A199W5R6_ANACO|nr:hypothetical protein ACMD2_05448 [Ananas comosus]